MEEELSERLNCGCKGVGRGGTEVMGVGSSFVRDGGEEVGGTW